MPAHGESRTTVGTDIAQLALTAEDAIMKTPTCVLRAALVLACVGLLSGTAGAATFTFSGYLNDPGNASLIGPDLGAPQFGDDWAIANNVALYALHVPFTGNVRFLSLGYGQGGADPYFTLFQGADNGATVIGSNYTQAFSTGGDFDLTFWLEAGDYQFAMGVFANMSIAENYGTGTLGDGFTFLGGPSYLGNSYYELAVTRPDGGQPPVPEPATMLLLGTGLAGLIVARKRQKR